MKIKRILHIDDEPYEVSGIKDGLIQNGFCVEQFVWPEDAEDPDREGSFSNLPDFSKYDLILLDVIMGPGNLGYHVTDQGFTTGLVFYRKLINPQFPNLPVFFVSALPESHFKERVSNYAVNHSIPYIQKTGDTVIEIIRHIEILEENAD